jgi:hypothetical protein
MASAAPAAAPAVPSAPPSAPEASAAPEPQHEVRKIDLSKPKPAEGDAAASPAAKPLDDASTPPRF